MAEVQTYEIEWAAKPLGFSIVMDTTGKNAYVSSIQKESNKQKGLKLAAQIIKINGEQVKGADHKKILEKIKKATLPIRLVFQPRSFANDPQKSQNESEVPTPIIFTGATVNQQRINGFFELVADQYNGKHQWQRKDDLEDPVLLWYWPSSQAKNTTGKDLWMIGRKSFRDTDQAYACCSSNADYPTQIDEKIGWKCYSVAESKYVGCKIAIQQERQ